jgi:hypothetical protein
MIKRMAIWLTIALLGPAVPVLGHVNLELRPDRDVAEVDDVILIGLYAVSDSSQNQAVRGLQVILQWDPAVIMLDPSQPLINNGPYPWLMSGFYPDSGADGLNNTWGDGDAYYQAVGNFSSLAMATPQGLLVTTFRFIAIGHALGTSIQIPATAGQYTYTAVFGQQVSENIVGTLGSASLKIVDWGLLALQMGATSCCVVPGEVVTVQLTVADIEAPINGVQASIAFDDERLAFQSITKGDGAGSPWGAAAEVYLSVADGRITYALVLLASSTSADAVVATMRFTALSGAEPGPAYIEILPEVSPLVTKLTLAEDGSAILTHLGAPVATAPIAMKGDMNGDGVRNGADVQGFVDAWLAAQPTPGELCAADMNCSCALTLADLQLFVQCLLTGQCACP